MNKYEKKLIKYKLKYYKLKYQLYGGSRYDFSYKLDKEIKYYLDDISKIKNIKYTENDNNIFMIEFTDISNGYSYDFEKRAQVETLKTINIYLLVDETLKGLKSIYNNSNLYEIIIGLNYILKHKNIIHDNTFNFISNLFELLKTNNDMHPNNIDEYAKLAEKFNIVSINNKTIKEELAEENKIMIKLLTKPSAYSCKSKEYEELQLETHNNCLVVPQGYMKKCKSTDNCYILSTYGLGPCICFILYNTEEGAYNFLGHIDALTALDNLTLDFFGIKDKKNVSIYLVGGDQVSYVKTAVRIYKYLEQLGLSDRIVGTNLFFYKKYTDVGINTRTGHVKRILHPKWYLDNDKYYINLKDCHPITVL